MLDKILTFCIFLLFVSIIRLQEHKCIFKSSGGVHINYFRLVIYLVDIFCMWYLVIYPLAYGIDLSEGWIMYIVLAGIMISYYNLVKLIMYMHNFWKNG